jgi:hypothetical protein
VRSMRGGAVFHMRATSAGGEAVGLADEIGEFGMLTLTPLVVILSKAKNLAAESHSAPKQGRQAVCECSGRVE